MSAVTIRLFAADLDGTLLGNDPSRRRLNTRWALLPAESRPLLCYNTGRMIADVLQLIERRVLLEPDYIISGVGTQIYDFRAGRVLKDFAEILEEGWDSATVESLMEGMDLPLEKQPAHFQMQFKSSWYLHDAGDAEIAAIRRLLDEAGLQTPCRLFQRTPPGHSAEMGQQRQCAALAAAPPGYRTAKRPRRRRQRQ